MPRSTAAVASTWTTWPRWRLSTIAAAADLDEHGRQPRCAGSGQRGHVRRRDGCLSRTKSIRPPLPVAATCRMVPRPCLAMVARAPTIAGRWRTSRRCTSRATPPCSTSCAAAHGRPEPKKFRELVREITWLVGYEALADARLDAGPVKTPIEETDGATAGRPHRPGAHPARRAGHGRRDARADAHRAGLAPGPVPRRAHAATGRVLQQAARLGDRRPVPDPRPDAGHGRIGHGGDRGAQALGRRHRCASS